MQNIESVNGTSKFQIEGKQTYGLLDRVRTQREIQEAKINLIKMLAECKTEAQLKEVMQIKDEFMKNIRSQRVELKQPEEEKKQVEL